MVNAIKQSDRQADDERTDSRAAMAKTWRQGRGSAVQDTPTEPGGTPKPDAGRGDSTKA